MIGLAYHLLKRGQGAVEQLRAMPEDQQAELAEQANDVRKTLGGLGVAIRSSLTQAVSEHHAEQWQHRKREALNPSPEFIMAKRIVRTLGESGQALTVRALVRTCGATGSDDSAFLLAIRLTALEGFIEEKGDCWAATSSTDMDLDRSAHARRIEADIVNYVTAVGLAERDELAAAAGATGPTADEFLDGLERALSAGSVEWLSWSLYGVPLQRLRALSPPDSGTSNANDPDLTKAALAVGTALQGLTRKFAERNDPSAHTDPSQTLERLAKLRESGAITDADFAAKKAELLARM